MNQRWHSEAASSTILFGVGRDQVLRFESEKKAIKPFRKERVPVTLLSYPQVRSQLLKSWMLLNGQRLHLLHFTWSHVAISLGSAITDVVPASSARRPRKPRKGPNKSCPQKPPAKQPGGGKDWQSASKRERHHPATSPTQTSETQGRSRRL